MSETFDLALINGKAFIDSKLINANIFVSDNKIKTISKKKFKAEETINCKNEVILPGLIDAHVHFREPGLTKKEDFITGSKAALHAGFTTVIDMPNNKPAITSIKLLKEKFLLARKMLVNYSLNFGASNENISETKKLESIKGINGIKVFMAESTGNLFVSDSSLNDLFDFSGKHSLPLILHAEDQKTIKENEEKARKNNLNNPIIHSLIRSSEAEEIAVRKALSLQTKTNARIHFAHVSSRNALNLIINAKKNSSKITFEVSPHHLFLTEKVIDKVGNFAKVNPSIKTQRDQIALWDALIKNKIDIVASDHAPHLIKEKLKDYWNAPSGMPGIESMSLLLLNAVNNNFLSLKQFVNLLSFNPAKIFNLKGKGEIKTLNDADFTVVNLKKNTVIKDESLFTKCKWSVFNGLKLKGLITKTIVNGVLKYSNGRILNEKIKGERIQRADLNES